MTFATVRDIFTNKCSEHQSVLEFYSTLKLYYPDVRMQGLLVKPIEHNKEILRCLRNYSGETSSSTLKTWVQYVPKLEDITDLLVIDTVFNTQLLEHRIGNINQAFLKNYTKLSSLNLPDSVTDLFKDIAEFYKHESEKEGFMVSYSRDC